MVLGTLYLRVFLLHRTNSHEHLLLASALSRASGVDRSSESPAQVLRRYLLLHLGNSAQRPPAAADITNTTPSGRAGFNNCFLSLRLRHKTELLL